MTAIKTTTQKPVKSFSIFNIIGLAILVIGTIAISILVNDAVSLGSF